MNKATPKKMNNETYNKSSKRSTQKVSTSWGSVAPWYDRHLNSDTDTYHNKVVFPNLLRMIGVCHGKRMLDMACGQGIFSEKLRDQGAFVTGVDIAKELIALAEQNAKTIKEKGTHKVSYYVAPSHAMSMVKDKSIDIVVCVLALQNIEKLQNTIKEVKRVLCDDGKFFLVLNHPCFRIPKASSWGYDEHDGVQYRRIDSYVSESKVKIDMTPGNTHDKKFTVSFHRPLQVYMKALHKYGFAISRLEEWQSHRQSEKGPRKHAEDVSRKEIPLFMCIESTVL